MVEDSNKELIMSLGVRAFPTFRFYLEGNQVDETKGANINEVASKVRGEKSVVYTNKFVTCMIHRCPFFTIFSGGGCVCVCVRFLRLLVGPTEHALGLR